MPFRGIVLPVLAMGLLLAGCEGSTMMTHTFHNRTADTLVIQAYFDSLPWYDTVEVLLPPQELHTLYTYDMWGKCHDCFGLDVPMNWVDTLELSTHVWLDYPDDGDWTTETDEGLSWIRFDHTLNIGVADVE